MNSGIFSVFCSIRRPYITFKLPRRDMDPPPRPHNFFQYLAIGMCYFCRLWNGMCDRHRAEITVMQFTGHSLPVHHFVTTQWDFLPCLILSAKLYFTLVAFWTMTLSNREGIIHNSRGIRKMEILSNWALFKTYYRPKSLLDSCLTLEE